MSIKYQGRLLMLFAAMGLAACHTTPPPARSIINPPGCRFQDMQWQHDVLVINARGGQKQRLYFFHNLQQQKSILINHDVPFPSASAGWATDLKPDNWTAFAADKNNFTLSCYQKVKQRLVAVDCRSVLQACQMIKARFAVGAGGSYWVSENQKDYPSLQNEVRLRGIYW